jgi:para-nitrobenzyl esterase
MPAAALRQAQSEVFVYRFDWDEEPTLLGADLGVMLGAAHGFEIPFVFGHFELGSDGYVLFTEDNQAGRQGLAEQMMGYWAEFARTGAPGRGRDAAQVEWTAWDPNPGGAKFVVLDTQAGGGTRMAREALTHAGVLTALDADPRLRAPEDKCAVLRALAQWSRGFTKQDYAARAECARYPFGA